MVHVPEPAREVLAEQRAIGGTGTPQSDPLASSSCSSSARSRSTEPLWSEGNPCCSTEAFPTASRTRGSSGGSGAVPERGGHLSLRSDRPGGATLAEIYTTDDERTMSFEATLPFQRLIEEAYEEAGYELVEVPEGRSRSGWHS
jgi:hypothetical protein